MTSGRELDMNPRAISEPIASFLPLSEERSDDMPHSLFPFPPPAHPRFTFIDLFAGIGGFRLAMQEQGGLAFCRYITANDTGATGGHQYGFYVGKEAASILFEDLGQKGKNKERFVEITWQNDFTTDSRFKYYGVGTRNEYRMTRFGRNFPFLQDEYIGSLFMLVKDYRWRQVINEADRIRDKYLFTLQEGVSPHQLSEMKSEHVALVVPKSNLRHFPEAHQRDILSLEHFVGFLEEKQNIKN